MPDGAHDHVRSAEQPFLHDLACLLAAPMQAWTTVDGSIALSAGIQGVYLGDTRIVRELTLRADGWSVAHLSTDEGVPRRQEFRAVLRQAGTIIDPEILLVRERVIAGDALTETITLVNASGRPVTVALAVRVTADATQMPVIKAGGTSVGPMLITDGGWTDADDRVDVRLVADGACARDVHGFELTWHLEAPPGGSAAGSWSLHAVDGGSVVTAPRSRDVSADSGRIAVPDGRALDLGRLLHQAFADLDGLELTLRGQPEARFIAAGAPWFLTLFGRDSIVAASMLLPAAPQIAHGTLVALARLQGTTHDAASAEAPGKILHELRRDVTHHVGANERLSLPPRYYGTVDATPLWISLLHEAWRAGMSPDDVGALLPNLEAAVAWLRAAVADEPRGFLTYHDPTGHGLANQGWKDSGDAIRWADGSLAVGPIALCEVQGYSVRAARHAADLLDAFGRDGAADLRSWAKDMAERFREAFWVTDRVTGARYPAIALDARGDAVDGMASNMGHLLGTGMLDAGEQRAVVDRLMDPTMFSGFGIRTLSTTNGAYWPMRYHAGAVWPHDTAMIVDGMLADGYVEEARIVAEGLLAAAASFDWRLPELFAGVARDSSSRPVPYPASCRPQAWSAAAAVVIAQALGGAVRGAAPADAG